MIQKVEVNQWLNAMLTVSTYIVNRMDSFLKWVGISLKDLPILTQRHIETLAEAALTLQVMDSSPSR